MRGKIEEYQKYEDEESEFGGLLKRWKRSLKSQGSESSSEELCSRRLR